MAAGQDQAWAASGEAIGTARKPPYPPDHQTAQGAKRVTTSWLFVVFGESQSAVLDLADGIARRPCSKRRFPDSFYQKRSIFIQLLGCMALSEGG
jgi:hypothetical protein